jgi:histidyl-tRNA synthetase
MYKASTPKGTRDFLPAQSLKRNYIFDVIKKIYSLHGFVPIETPAMENTETLMGKYGAEGDRLIFKILNSGNFAEDIDVDLVNANNSTAIATKISEKALRYDLTVPFARFVVQHRNELNMPFKRYQIQPVWRADRPQKGRYREFYQCDADIIGSDSLWNELELIEIIHEVFTALQLPEIVIKVNNRKILEGISKAIGHPDKMTTLTVALDKIDKIGKEKVFDELRANGFDECAVTYLAPVLESVHNEKEQIRQVNALLLHSEVGIKGLMELDFILQHARKNPNISIVFDPSLARGLNYYTGTIIEVQHPDFNSSICGGGRYDDLTGIFGMAGLSGVGISFGADRIYDLLHDKKLFPESLQAASQILFVNFGDNEAAAIQETMRLLRNQSLRVEMYPDAGKLKKQFKYADDKKIAFVVIVGEEELKNGTFKIKNMRNGEEQNHSLQSMIETFKSSLL